MYSANTFSSTTCEKQIVTPGSSNLYCSEKSVLSSVVYIALSLTLLKVP